MGVDLFFVPAAWPKIRNTHWVRLIRQELLKTSSTSPLSIRPAARADWNMQEILRSMGRRNLRLEDEEEIAFGRIDTDVIQEVRSQINVFRDRRPDIDKITAEIISAI